MPRIDDKICLNIKEVETVVNFGCGKFNHFQKARYKSILGVDVWAPYLKLCKDKYMTLRMDVRDLKKHFIENSYDVCCAIDVIEHLAKEEAIAFIKDMKTVGRKRVLVFTPNGFVKQEDGHGWGKGNPEYQKHRCGFTQEELEELGFVVEKWRNPGAPEMLFGVWNK